MILYFSATGNSEHVARRIAATTDDKVVSIERFDVEAPVSYTHLTLPTNSLV